MSSLRVAPQLLTPDQVAERMGVSRSTVHNLISTGQLAAVDIRSSGTRPRLRVTEDDLAAFVAARALPSVRDEVTRRRKAAQA